jgi:hypothetical protein
LIFRKPIDLLIFRGRSKLTSRTRFRAAFWFHRRADRDSDRRPRVLRSRRTSESIMAPAGPAKIPPFVCRFEEASADGKADESYRDFCAFEFPGCAGCPKAVHAIADASTKEDPMKSIAWRGIQFPIAVVHFCDGRTAPISGQRR